MTTIKIEITEDKLKELVLAHLADVLDFPLKLSDINIETKSKQNYRSEWETAAFRAVVNRSVT